MVSASADEPGGPGSGGRADAATVHVRQYGHVEDEPVARRVGDRELFLGNGRAAHPGDHAERFEYVLSATRDPGPLTTHHHPLVDGPDADYGEFAAAVDAARRLHRRDGPLLVHCEAGISRSSALVATTLAAEEGLPLRDALDAAQDARPQAVPHPALHELAVVYLAAAGWRPPTRAETAT